MRPRHRFGVSIAVVALATGFLYWVDVAAKKARYLPDPGIRNRHIVRVAAQEDVYGAYRDLRLRGATVVHLNRHFNLVPYLPGSDAKPVPFPIPERDVRHYYEAGLDSHAWLFLASRAGFVRRVINVLPQGVVRELREFFLDDPEFVVTGDRFDGYWFDMPRTVVPPVLVPRIDEPVIVNMDAGFFLEGADPAQIAGMLRERLPDVRLLVLVDSVDEPEVDHRMRAALDAFAGAWKDS